MDLFDGKESNESKDENKTIEDGGSDDLSSPVDSLANDQVNV